MPSIMPSKIPAKLVKKENLRKKPRINALNRPQLTMPEMAKVETTLFRHLYKFHEKLLEQLGRNKIDTLRCTCWQLDAYLEENGKFKDADFIRTILATLEFYIQKKGGTNWSIAKAKKNAQGRTRGINQFSSKNAEKKRAPVPVKLSQEIDRKLLDIPRRELD